MVRFKTVFTAGLFFLPGVLLILILSSNDIDVVRDKKNLLGEFANRATNSETHLNDTTNLRFVGPIQSKVQDPPQQSSQEVAVQITSDEPQNQPLVEPFLYHLTPQSFLTLNRDQQFAILHLQKEYIEFYSHWMNNLSPDPQIWNDKMVEFQQKLMMDLGPEMADSIVK